MFSFPDSRIEIATASAFLASFGVTRGAAPFMLSTKFCSSSFSGSSARIGCWITFPSATFPLRIISSKRFLLLTAVLLLSVTTFLTAFSIVRERERGTLEQLFVTPVRPLGLLLGKILPYLVIGFVELCAILFFMRFVFLVPIHGHTLLLLLLSLPYLFVALSIGMLISTKAQTQAEAMQLAFLTFLPTIFFSGYIFPRETMPLPFYLLSFLVPATYFINITRGVILRGAGLMHLWVDALVLLGMGAGLLLLAAKRFQKKVIAT